MQRIRNVAVHAQQVTRQEAAIIVSNDWVLRCLRCVYVCRRATATHRQSPKQLRSVSCHRHCSLSLPPHSKYREILKFQCFSDDTSLQRLQPMLKAVEFIYTLVSLPWNIMTALIMILREGGKKQNLIGSGAGVYKHAERS
jgi:hypothetical protein